VAGSSARQRHSRICRMKCWKCRRTKLKEDDFPWKNRSIGLRHITCKKCMRAYRMAYYEKNKATELVGITARRKRHGQKIREIVLEAKDRPCMDCGVHYHAWVMDFDHREHGDKEFLISKASWRGNAIERVIAEIAKCDVVCANCHRMRTFTRKYGPAVGTGSVCWLLTS
jgi:hypothetical protein